MDKWQETIKLLEQIPSADLYIDQQGLDNVRVFDIGGKGTFKEYAFNHNGFDCFVRLHQFNNGKSIGEVMAFDNDRGVAFYKRIEEL